MLNNIKQRAWTEVVVSLSPCSYLELQLLRTFLQFSSWPSLTLVLGIVDPTFLQYSKFFFEVRNTLLVTECYPTLLNCLEFFLNPKLANETAHWKILDYSPVLKRECFYKSSLVCLLCLLSSWNFDREEVDHCKQVKAEVQWLELCVGRQACP